ncbi:hypothetical protein ILFOPFJJ_00836 [Ensifer psoraleae]|uniref:DUF6236 family protein n=1 Tax=Sinorhizobium psoraleae TaxID=520838 RepID=UPI0015691F14|nr:DUF6236 family protein [Sinorhizobium psoraleae]NRP69959.1 hypothetical protein [Sinorhizobium psoraleae]
MSPPIEIYGNSLTVKNSAIDEQEIRFSLLFFDRMMWPDNNLISIGSSTSAAFLEQCGILTRPRYRFTSGGEATKLFVELQLSAFEDMEEKEPGLWALSNAYVNVVKHSPKFAASGGSHVDLLGAIPVPDKDVPLNDILEFKEKRRDQLLGLRIEIQNLASAVMRAGDDAGVFISALEKIEKGCLEVLAVTKEASIPFRLSNVRPRFELDLAKIVGAFVTSAAVQTATSMPKLSLALLALNLIKDNVSIKVGGDITRKAQTQTSPFQYVASYHDEVFKIG